MPPFKMTLSKEQVEGRENVPKGIYMVRFIGFEPKLSKFDPANPNKERSINLNAKFEIIDNPEYAGRFLYEIMNMKQYGIQTEVCHGLGIPLEAGVDANGEPEYWIPGTWDNKPGFNPADPATFEYKGPLTGKTGRVEVTLSSYNGKDSSKINRYFCAIENCATKFPEIRHQDNLVKS